MRFGIIVAPDNWRKALDYLENIIESVVVDGFWGGRTIEFKFFDDVNFIIGINGSGKITVVNLIVASLTANFYELNRIDFTKLTIKMKRKGGRKRPSIIIRKSENSDMPFSSIEYEIRESASDKSRIFSLDDFEEQLMLRRYPRHIVDREYRRHSQDISGMLKKLINVSWLSVHRASGIRDDKDNDKYESTVDKKLSELSNRLVRYFSTLGKSGAEQFEVFQKEVFLSMLFRKNQKAVFSSALSIDVDGERRALEGIFSQFRVMPKDLRSRLDVHFDALQKAKEKISAKEPLNYNDISVLVGSDRIDYIVEEWKKSVNKRDKIFEPRDTFLEIINSMMQRKIFSINSQNELQITTQSGKDLPLRNLSSGEKQLLIVLGEALLQEKRPWVYIADEPELSLHVRWQESLVENLRAINPNSQIIFATHSPDVVSFFQDRIFDMESMIS